MASTYSDLKIELIGTGEQTGTWGTTTNDNFSIAIGEAITGSADVAFSSADVTVTLTNTNASQAARNLRLNLTGTSGGARQLILGSGCQIDKLYLINNGLADAVTVKNTSGTGIAVPAGKSMFVFNNGTDVVEAVNSAVNLDVTTLDATNIEVTNIKAKDGTASATIANSTGIFTHSTATVFTAGSVSAPSITTTGDTNTGIFFPAADTIAFTEGGVESMRIDSSGFVGIGTSSPSSFFDGARNLVVGTGSGAQGMTIYAGTADSSNIFFADGTSTPAQYIGQIRYFHDNNYMMFVTNDGERMRITSAGNLGIGNSSPQRILTVGSGSASTVMSIFGGTGSSSAIHFTDTNTSTDFQGFVTYAHDVDAMRFGTAETERMRIDSSGNVGIGTSGPSTLLHLSSANTAFTATSLTSTSSTQLRVVTVAGTCYFAVDGSGGSSFGTADAAVVWNSINSPLLFATNNSERMRITSAGNVGIGTSSPVDKLTVTVDSNSALPSCTLINTNGGSVAASRLVFGNNVDTAPGLIFASSTNSTFGANSLVMYQNNAAPVTFWTNNTERMRITSDGDVGIGTTSPSSKLGLSIDNATMRIGHVVSDDRNINLRVNTGYNASITFTEEAVSDRWSIGTKSGIDGFIFATGNSLAGGTERTRLTSGGTFLVAKTGQDVNVVGAELRPDGVTVFTANSQNVLYVNRLTNDGDLVQFLQASAVEGSISVSGSTVSYNGGHLSRWSQLPDNSKDDTILKGTVLTNLDDMCVWEKEGVFAENEQLNKMKVSDVEGDTNVAGVFVNWTIDEQYGVDDMNVAMTGDMIIRIAGGVVVQKGDLLMSAGDGTAKPQGDDIVRSKTIAKVTSNYVTCTYADGSYCVPCVLMAC